MAYSCPRDLDGFMPHLAKNDTKFRQQLGADLLAFLADPANAIVCQDIGQLIDGIIQWMQSSNYKVSSNGIEIMTHLTDRLGNDFRPYLQTVLPCVVDRLGDAKDTVREKAQLLILKLLEREVLSPQSLLDKLTAGFTHKNAKIREEVLRCFVNTLNEHGAQSVTLSKFIPHIVKLLADPASSVRDTAFATMVELYKHVGEKLRIDLQKRNLVPPAKLQTLLARFDDVRDSGELHRTASTNQDLYSDEVDRIAMPKPLNSAKKAVLGSAKKPFTAMRSNSNVCAAGAVDEDVFVRQFEDVPMMQLFNAREVNDHMKSIQEIISDPNKDWNKRVEALKKIRSLVIADATIYDDFYANLRNLEYALQMTIKDLRSQVVREACITIAFLAQRIGSKFDHAAECLLNSLINLIQNSAKIMATSGLTCVRFIIQHTQSARLIPIITTNLQTSKSKEIRRSCCEFLEIILSFWSTHSLEKHVAVVQESVKRGIADADPDARVVSRKAFRGFRDHFPEQAEALLQSLDPSYRKALQSELCLSNSSSSGSLATMTTPAASARSTTRYRAPMLSANSAENLFVGLQRAPSLPRTFKQRSGIPVLSNSASARKGFRSNSAIDLQAAQRAKARSQYSAYARQKIASGTVSLHGGGDMSPARAKKNNDGAASSLQTADRTGRSRSRTCVSHSQPTSRSGSPSSQLSYMYHRSNDSDSPRPRRLSSGIPRSITGSRDASRETSPTRSMKRICRNADRPPLSPATRPPVMAQKILQQSREAETALADALTPDGSEIDYHKYSTPRKMRSLETHSDDSETSSVCSERSSDSFRRPSDSYSWSGSQNRLSSRDYWEPTMDVNEIIQLCACTNWQDRKDGLVSLQSYLSSGMTLSGSELKHITDFFTRMFVDSHTKGLSVFLDTVNELIKRHNADMHDWLHILLQRIFLKMGSDLLMSASNKLQATLDNVRASFPIALQLHNVYKIITDVHYTPNTKARLSVINYLASVCRLPDASLHMHKAPACAALQKIVSYIRDAKSLEIRNAASVCILAMWNCNVADFTMMMKDLPAGMQEIVQGIIQTHMHKDQEGSKLSLSPGTAAQNDFNSEDVYKSLKRTTAEIQNYTYETLGSKLDRERDTTSHDSGISQMSLGNEVGKNEIGSIEERFESMHIRHNYASHSVNVHALNGMHVDVNDHDVVASVVETCAPESPLPIEQKCALLEKLIEIIKDGKMHLIIPNFKKLLKIIIDTLKQKEARSCVIVLRILEVILKQAELKPSWSEFIELIVLQLLDALSDENREVVRIASEMTASAMSVFPFDIVIKMLSPLLKTSTYPKIDGVIKMITRVIDLHPAELSDEHLNDIMPGLIKANDHHQSSARKSAVFCMVAIHKAVGEERMGPHLQNLPASKMKLIQIYIAKEQDSAAKSARVLKV